MAGVCVGDGREGETMGVDEGRDGRKRWWWGGGFSVLCSSAFVLLDNNSPPPSDSQNRVNLCGLETGARSGVFRRNVCHMIRCEVLMVSTVSHFS